LSETKYGKFHFRGGHPALDFINTASQRNDDPITERIGSYEDLVGWAEQAGVIGRERAVELRAIAAGQPRAASGALRRARALREAAFRLFGSLIDGVEPADEDLSLLNRRARRVAPGGAVRWDGDGFSIDAPPPSAPLDEPLDRVTRGIVEVLTGDNSDYVSRCQDPDCGWLFLDRSPARARRWCSMADCGNRAKARRHYRRRKAERV
jgi:predicted RNA-binding Zn ribbon-like protein